jgi:3-hydroxymyristoyl/3-hydroxydecanoyl-(acyl carrier protein) dehydratase
MPGVLLLEAMAQASGFLVLNTIPNPETKLMYFTGINKSRFKKVVIPGDQLIFEAELVKFRLGTCKIVARALVDDKVVCSAEFLSSVVDRRD